MFLDWAQHGLFTSLPSPHFAKFFQRFALGICGRGVLVDMVKFYTEDGTKPLPYDPWSTHAIPVRDIEAAAAKQGVQFRQADILILRIGFMQVSYFFPLYSQNIIHLLKRSLEVQSGNSRGKRGTFGQTCCYVSIALYQFFFHWCRLTLSVHRAGIQQGEEMKEFLW